MLIRTLSGDPPELCISPTLFDGDVEAARRTAERLDRRGYLPPPEPITQAELDEHQIREPFRTVLWNVLGLGLTIDQALVRAKMPRGRSMTRSIQRLIKQIGWNAD